MVLTKTEWEIIAEFVAKNPGSRVWELFKIRNSIGLVQQRGVDREMLRELNMKDSTTYAFNCDVVHNLEKYTEALHLVSQDHGWDEHNGPTDSVLLHIYRSRLLDPELEPEYKTKMDIGFAYCPRLVDFKLDEAVKNERHVKVTVEMDISVEKSWINVKLADREELGQKYLKVLLPPIGQHGPKRKRKVFESSHGRKKRRKRDKKY